MEISKISMVYFSPTYSTQKVLRYIADGLGGTPVSTLDITQGYDSEVTLERDELLLVGVPVYSGRVPQAAAKALRHFKGQSTPAIIACVYGNRAYDDALLELKNMVEENGFKLLSAGAFVARHSIFPSVASLRPDEEDRAAATDFGRKSLQKLAALEGGAVASLPAIRVKGNFPYREVKSVPLKPRGNRRCNECGTCAKLCPTGAIAANKPRETDRAKCIACARCIAVCPQHARHFGGILYRIVSAKFSKKYALRKPVEVFLS